MLRFIDPPHYEDIREQMRASVLRYFQVFSYIMTLALVLLYNIDPENAWRWLYTGLYNVSITTIGFILLQNRLPKAASIMAVIQLFVFSFFVVYTAGGLFSISFTYFFITIILAGILIGKKAGVITAGFSMAALTVIYFLHQQGLIPENKVIHNEFSRLINYYIFIIMISILMFLYSLQNEKALSRAMSENICRNEAESRLAQSYAELKGLFNAAIRVAIIATDRRGIITHFSSGAERMLGYSAGETVGKETPMLFHDAVEVRERSFDLSRGNDKPVQGFDVFIEPLKEKESDTREWTYIRKDGGRVSVELAVTAVRDEAGTVNGYLGTAVDITDRKQAEERLSQEKNFTDRLLDSLPGIFYMYDDGLRLKRWNKAHETDLGYSSADLLNKYMGEWHKSPESREKAVDAVRKMLKYGGKPDFMVSTLLHKDGREIPYLLSSVRLETQSGPVMMGVGVDITERVRAELDLKSLNARLEQIVAERTADLEHANRELEAFVYSVSHDLRSPLRAVRGFMDIILEDYGNGMSPDEKNLVDKVRAASLHMGDMIEDLLKLSRVIKAELNLTQVDLTEICEKTALEVQSSEAGRSITWDIMSGMSVTADRNLISIAMTNLISNAFKFTRNKAPAVISIHEEIHDNKYRITVKDNGAGFDMAYADRLFGVFQRLHKETEFPGTGVGLSIVRRIAERHGGSVEAVGVPDRGAEFTLVLPV